MKKLDIISTNIRVDSLSWLYSLLIIVMSTGDFQRRWNVLSLSFSERESGNWALWLSNLYRNYLISNDCIHHSGRVLIE